MENKQTTEPLKHHGPGWRLIEGPVRVTLWAPAPDRNRPTWCADWGDSDDENVGNFAYGDSAEEALRLCLVDYSEQGRGGFRANCRQRALIIAELVQEATR